MAYSNNTVPLVVKDSGNITVNSSAILNFDGCGTVTAISNGDTGTHTITIAGGWVLRTNGDEMFVAMGVTVNSGTLQVSGTGQGPFHITQASAGPGNGGLVVHGGSVSLSSSLSVDQGVFIDGGVISVGTNATLTSGQNGAPATFYILGGWTFLKGTVTAHGGIDMLGGNVDTGGATTAKIQMDVADQFWMGGGTLYVSGNQAWTGKLEVAGNMTIDGGDVEVNCASDTGDFGQLVVDGNLTITPSNTASFGCGDFANAPGAFSFAAITVLGTQSGDFSLYELPWVNPTHTWAGGVLTIAWTKIS